MKGKRMRVHSRRSFLKRALMLAPAALPLFPATAEASPQSTELEGVSDLHVHLEPDIRPRSDNALNYVRLCRQAKMRSVLLKSHIFPTFDLAYLIRQSVDFEVFGGLCLNRQYGIRAGVEAVRAALQCSGQYLRCVWLPTLDAVHQRGRGGIPVLDTYGRVLPEIVSIMELCAQEDIMLASGHSSPEESLILARKARETGLTKFVVTHANTAGWTHSADQVKRCLDAGAWMEYGYGWEFLRNGQDASRPCDRLVNYIRLAPERSFVMTDMGSPSLPHPLTGMRLCVRNLRESGLSPAHLSLVLKENPAALMKLS